MSEIPLTAYRDLLDLAKGVALIKDEPKLAMKAGALIYSKLIDIYGEGVVKKESAQIVDLLARTRAGGVDSLTEADKSWIVKPLPQVLMLLTLLKNVPDEAEYERVMLAAYGNLVMAFITDSGLSTQDFLTMIDPVLTALVYGEEKHALDS